MTSIRDHSFHPVSLPWNRAGVLNVLYTQCTAVSMCVNGFQAFMEQQFQVLEGKLQECKDSVSKLKEDFKNEVSPAFVHSTVML